MNDVIAPFWVNKTTKSLEETVDGFAISYATATQNFKLPKDLISPAAVKAEYALFHNDLPELIRGDSPCEEICKWLDNMESAIEDEGSESQTLLSAVQKAHTHFDNKWATFERGLQGEPTADSINRILGLKEEIRYDLYNMAKYLEKRKLIMIEKDLKDMFINNNPEYGLDGEFDTHNTELLSGLKASCCSVISKCMDKGMELDRVGYFHEWDLPAGRSGRLEFDDLFGRDSLGADGPHQVSRAEIPSVYLNMSHDIGPYSVPYRIRLSDHVRVKPAGEVNTIYRGDPLALSIVVDGKGKFDEAVLDGFFEGIARDTMDTLKQSNSMEPEL